MTLEQIEHIAAIVITVLLGVLWLTSLYIAIKIWKAVR